MDIRGKIWMKAFGFRTLSVAPYHQATFISRLTDDGRKSRVLEHILPYVCSSYILLPKAML